MTRAATRWVWLSLAGLVVAAGAGIAFISLGGDEDTEPQPRATPSPQGTVGLEDGVRYELISGSCGYGVVVSPQGNLDPQRGEFCLISVDIRNRNDDRPVSFDASCQFLIDSTGSRHTQRPDAMALEEESADFFAMGLPPNTVAREVGLYYDVPMGTELAAIEMRTTCGSPGVLLDATA